MSKQTDHTDTQLSVDVEDITSDVPEETTTLHMSNPSNEKQKSAGTHATVLTQHLTGNDHIIIMRQNYM